MRRIIIVCFLFVSAQTTQAQIRLDKNAFMGKLLFKETDENAFQLRDVFRNGAALEAENPRLVAICLNVTLGLFGMHRMYLGTELTVPLAYTLTIGGGCILWLIDLGLLIGTKDITSFFNNPNMFMWTKE